jgi:hypothetical protein
MQLNSRFLRLLTTATISLFSLGVIAHGTNKETSSNRNDTLKLLLVGNSFSLNAAHYLSDLADEAGFPLIIEQAAIGGASMQKHWDVLELAEREPENPDGKPYQGRSLKEVLAGNDWDIVSIQQVSFQSGDTGTYHPYARNLYDLVKELQPEARVVMHETWAYRIDSKDFTQIPGGKHAESSEEMWQNLRMAYYTIASELGVEVIPVGDAFWKVSSNRKWGYREDTTFEEDEFIYPEIPVQENSLHSGFHWNRDKEFVFDSHHASDAGCFLGSLVLYSYLSGQSPKKLDFVPEQVPEKFARYLKKAAWSVTKNK